MESKKLSPYLYVSDLLSEKVEDSIIQEIQNLCLFFIESRDIFFDSYDIEETNIAMNFVKIKINDLIALKKTFGLKSDYTPFKNIGHSLDLLTCTSELEQFNLKSVYYELEIQVSTIMDSLTFYYNILQIIEKERNESNNKRINN